MSQKNQASAILQAIEERTQLLEELALAGNWDHPAWKSNRHVAKLTPGGGGACKFADPGAKAAVIQANDATMSIPWVISTPGVDREGDVIVPAGCTARLGSYERNPVVFFGHQKEPLPVGVSRGPDGSLSVAEVDGNLLSTCFFHGKTLVSAQCYELAKIGVLSAASIGFIPYKGKRLARAENPDLERDDIDFSFPGFLIEDWELVEWSIVGVPCNGEAIRLSLEKGAAGKPLDGVLRRSIEPFAPARKAQVVGGFARQPAVVIERERFGDIVAATAWIKSVGLDASDYSETPAGWIFRQACRPDDSPVNMAGEQVGGNATTTDEKTIPTTTGGDTAMATKKKSKQIPKTFFQMLGSLYGLTAKEVADQAGTVANEKPKGEDEEGDDKPQLPPGAVTMKAFKEFHAAAVPLNEHPDVLKFLDKAHKDATKCAMKAYPEHDLGYEPLEEEEEDDDETEDDEEGEDTNSSEKDEDEGEGDDELSEDEEKELADLEARFTRLTGAHA